MCKPLALSIKYYTMGTTYTNHETEIMNKYQIAYAAKLDHFKCAIFANNSDGYCVIMEQAGFEFEFFDFNELQAWAGV